MEVKSRAQDEGAREPSPQPGPPDGSQPVLVVGPGPRRTAITVIGRAQQISPKTPMALT